MTEFNEAQKALLEEIQKKRFYTINQSGQTDLFIRAFVIILSTSEQGVNMFNRKSREKEFMSYMNDLGLAEYGNRTEEEQAVYREEWHAFAKRYIDICRQDKNYGSTVFGLLKMKKNQVVNKIENDINIVTKVYPCEFQKQEMTAPLYQIMMEELELQKEALLREE